MSRIGKKPIDVPSGVKVSVGGGDVTVEGKLGALTTSHRPEIKVEWDEDGRKINVSLADENDDRRESRAVWGTTRALIANNIKGVTDGYEKKMQIEGVGWNAVVEGQNLKLSVGFANAVMMPIPQGVDVSVERQLVTIKGTSKQVVGQFASEMRAKKKPEPYKGKGIRYADEVIRRKQGKTFGA